MNNDEDISSLAEVINEHDDDDNEDDDDERRNRQDLTDVFKMSKGMTRIRLQELFTLNENNKGTKGGHSLKLAKLRCSRDCWKHFFQIGLSTTGMGWISRRLGPLASMFF